MTDYIRGAGVGGLSARMVARVAVAIVGLVLVSLVVVLAAQAIGENSRADRLKRGGVAVTVTVTSCAGLASGTGITADGYDCKATFTLGTHHYESVIGGSSGLLPEGQRLAAIADPKHPATLSAAGAASTPRSHWKAYIPAGVALLCLGALVALVVITERRGPGRRS